MRRVSLAIFVLATTLIVDPSSILGDSFGYKVSGPDFGAGSGSAARLSAVPGGIAESGIFTNAEFPGTVQSNYGGMFGRNTIERPIDGAFFFDNLLQAGTPEFGTRDNTGVLVDLSGREMVLLSGTDGGEVTSGGKSRRFYFADKGSYRVSNELQRGSGAARSNATSLTVTPEPGSLFLLGTGLLGLALVLFWKAARRSTGS